MGHATRGSGERGKSSRVSLALRYIFMGVRASIVYIYLAIFGCLCSWRREKLLSERQ